MAPEVIKNNAETYKSDVWSLGCTVIELFSGLPPYAHLASMVWIHTFLISSFNLNSIFSKFIRLQSSKLWKILILHFQKEYHQYFFLFFFFFFSYSLNFCLINLFFCYKKKELKEFLLACLQKDADQRLTVEELLTLPWVTNAQDIPVFISFYFFYTCIHKKLTELIELF